MQRSFVSRKKGFSLIELLVVFTIISLLTLVIIANLQTARARARDSQVRSDKQRIILALVKAREAAIDYIYPGVSGWQCLKSSGSCFQGSGGSGGYNGNATIANALAPYLPGSVIPSTPASPGDYMYDSYLYNPNVQVPDFFVSGTPCAIGITCPMLLWYQEKPIQQSECNGVVLAPTYDPGTYYCLEKLPK